MARERWYWVDAQKGRLMQHSENDGWTFMRRGPEAVETEIDIDKLSPYELREALREVVNDYPKDSKGQKQ